VVGSVAAELAAGQWQHQQRQRGTTNNQQSTKRAAGSSAVAMFPLFITHDEYFVRSGGSGGGTMFWGTVFFICPATNFFVIKNSVKYGLHTNIIPQEKYKGMIPVKNYM
jgi:hypothetical protein